MERRRPPWRGASDMRLIGEVAASGCNGAGVSGVHVVWHATVIVHWVAAQTDNERETVCAKRHVGWHVFSSMSQPGLLGRVEGGSVSGRMGGGRDCE